MILTVVIIILGFFSNYYLKNINLFINKIKKAKNIVLLVLSLVTIPKLTNLKQKTKRKLSNSHKKYIASSQQWRCNICKNILDHTYEIDHINPLYKGGNNLENNLQALCRNCHGKKTFNDNLIGF
uniref:HNH nuclease domain-containing protein n=1 Tax=viral metagenome TaxID=1070528 RepID=A0A6C0IXZ9_9ZZZZ